MIILVLIAACLFVYALLICKTTNLTNRTRAWLVGGYALLHAVSWLFMHMATSHEFESSVIAMHVECQQDIERELALYAAHGTQLNSEEVQMIKERVHPKPYWSFVSLSPLPGVLVVFRSSMLGRLNGRGEICLYVFTGMGFPLVWKERTWIS